MRANDRYLEPLHKMPVVPGSPIRWAQEIPDEDVEDIVTVEVKVFHRMREGGQYEQVGDSAGAKYKYPTSGLEYRFQFNPDELVAERVGRLAEDAANLVLNQRRLIHEHKKVVVSGG